MFVIMARIESASESSLFLTVQRLCAIPFVVSLVLGWRHVWAASAVSLVVAFLLSAAVSDVRVGADAEGLRLAWMWLRCKVPWTDVQALTYQAEFIGGRLSVVFCTRETLVISSVMSLKYVESLARSHAAESRLTSHKGVGRPWWLTGHRARAQHSSK
jgi:hypothetical protein